MGFCDRLKRAVNAMRLAWSSYPAGANTRPCQDYHDKTPSNFTAQFSEKNPKGLKDSGCDSSTITEAPPAYAHQNTPAPHEYPITIHHAGNISQAPARLSTLAVNVNTIDKHGYTPLLYAAQKGRTGIVKRLLKDPDVNVNPCDTFGISALSWAARRGHLEVVEMLLKTPGVLANQKCDKGRTPLLRAAMKGHVAIVEALLKVPGVEIDVKDSTGSTPLLLASLGGHEEVVTLLLRENASRV